MNHSRTMARVSPRVAFGKARARQRGAIMVITLLAVVLLAALIFYVINLGRQANARIVAQHAADATAAAGAGWIARGFNTVAMNNVSTARLIVTADVLDAMPMVFQFTHEDQLAALEAVESQLQRGVNDAWVRDAFVVLRGELQREVELLAPLDVYFNQQYDVTQMTHYEAPSGRGTLWRAMEAMDIYSQATMENLGVLAQLNAMRGGEVNLDQDADTDDENPLALMVPVMTQIPWKRGTFDDFERPVRLGLLPTAIDDATNHRGPFDVVFGWRFGRASDIEGYYEEGSGEQSNAPGGGRPSVPFGSGPGGGGIDGAQFVVTKVEWETYGVYGPLEWVLQRLDDFADNHLYHSRFGRWCRDIAGIKISYVWPGDDIKQVTDPQWETDWASAIAIAESDPSKIQSTAFLRCEIKSIHPRGGSGFMSPGTWAYKWGRENPDEHPATVVRAGGWHDPRRWEQFGVEKVNDHIWRDEWDYRVYYDYDLGLLPKVDADGKPVVYTVYRIDEYAFAGVDVGEPVDVRNPFNWTSKDDLPAPIDFDHAQMPPTQEVRDQKLTFLAVVERANRSLFWPSRFESGKPYHGTVAMAQAEVFNNHSWDLWTQMWHAQIEAVDDYDRWMTRLAESAGQVGNIPTLDPARVDRLFDYLKSVEPLADVMLYH